MKATFSSLVRHLAFGREYRTVSDQELLREHVEGNPTAFEALVIRHSRVIYGACRTVLRGNEADIADVFQDTVMKLHMKAASLGKDSSVSGWLWRVARNNALKVRARASRNRAALERAARDGYFADLGGSNTHRPAAMPQASPKCFKPWMRNWGVSVKRSNK